METVREISKCLQFCKDVIEKPILRSEVKSLKPRQQILCALILTTAHAMAQTPAAPPGGRGPRPAAYPQRPPAEPAALERGKALYGVNCNFCHGSGARGGEGGPNLL